MSNLNLPPEYQQLKQETVLLRAKLSELHEKMGNIRKEAIQAMGWNKCCRCFPRAISDDGYCSCCDMNHATGERLDLGSLDNEI